MMAPLAFTAQGLDRADHLRSDPDALARLRAAADARMLAMDGLAPIMDADDRLQWVAVPADGPELVFLGLADGAPHFAPVPAAGDTRPAYEQRPSWSSLARLSGAELAIYGAARSLVDWHARHRFCAQCGAPSVAAKGGWQRDCTQCNAPHFPRTDPVAIMLVEHDGALLLGRNARYPARSYSALAGFIEPGETIEQAVAREVLEEAGVVARDVSYIASQPWPFPSQLMIGCHAFAESRELVIDVTEIEDARWFTRSEIIEALANGADAESFVPPPVTAIAHQMLHWWLEKTDERA